MTTRYWLMKSEPGEYSLEDLKNEPEQTDHWDGVRNYQARNFMRDEMRIGDQVFFYHSSCAEPGIAGIAKVASKPYPDPTQFDRKSDYHDPKSDPDDPRWFLVDLAFVRKLKRVITLADLKSEPRLDDMLLTRRGNRLSVMPVDKAHWKLVLSLE